MSRTPISSVVRTLRRSAVVGVAGFLGSGAFAQSGVVNPWFFNGDGDPVWKRHQYWEDPSNTVFTLAWDFLTIAGQPSQPDVLLFNGPVFDPPESVPAAAGTRRLVDCSIEHRSLQLYVNYGGVTISTPSVETYAKPTFFISLDVVNQQTTPSVPAVGLSSYQVAATRGALGNVGTQLGPKSRAPLWHETGASLFPMNALYVTAGVPFPTTDFVAAQQQTVDDACVDLLFVRQSDQTWLDRSSLVPFSVRAGNSSGACFADFNGDGYQDLFVGKPGVSYAGGQSCLLLYQPASGSTPEAFIDKTATNLPALNVATVDVAAVDLDGDLDIDIVLGNRMRRDPATMPEMYESADYVLINNGAGVFTETVLAHGRLTDTRSVAVGNLDKSASPELVFANAGANGFSNTLVVPGADDHPLQIFRNNQTPPAFWYVDDVDAFIDPLLESEMSRPFAWQAVIADVFAPDAALAGPLMPDGKPDLFIVNHRDILLDATANGLNQRSASNVRILVNPDSSTTDRLIDRGRIDVSWATTLAVADFSRNDDANYGVCSAGTPDLFIAAGNTFNSADPRYMENRGAAAGAWPPWNESATFMNHLTYEALPGNERGYGFDFADYDSDQVGWMDALQTARGYNFSVTNLGTTVQHLDALHWNLTKAASDVDFSNKRGQLLPWGAEDGVFADFDKDGTREILLASQIGSSGTFPGSPDPQTHDTAYLRNGGAAGFLHSTTSIPATHVPASPNPNFVNITVDSYLNLNGRDAYHRPFIADRVIAVDFDNDADEDAFVHLFPIHNPNGGSPANPEIGTNGLTAPVGKYSVGFRYLLNSRVDASTPPPWFKDVAAGLVHDGTYGAGFSTKWNRERGVDVAADFDNNGACDVFNAVGAPQVVGTDVTDIAQGHDLIFMNAVVGAPVGTLVERSVAIGLPQRIDTAGTKTLGCGGLAQGDVNNDGWSDLFVSCGAREDWSELLMGTPGASWSFVDDFFARVPTHKDLLDPIVHSKLFPGSTTLRHDDVGSPIFVDLDADGDLDLVYAVAQNVPRMFLNQGQDVNQDGWIDAADDPAPPATPLRGTFVDATGTLVTQIRPLYDSVDAQSVDLDRDGDLDLAFDCFDDEVVLWRNDLAQLGNKPAVSEAWPRIGCVRGRRVYLEGKNLTGARAVQLRSVSTGVTKTIASSALTAESQSRISFLMPSDAPLGLVQIRVRRANPPTPADEWSKQYFGYFVLGP